MVNNFVRSDSGPLESLWKNVENRLHDAINACEEGRALGAPQHVSALKQAIALHFVRSIELRLVYDRLWGQHLTTATERWARDTQMLTRAFFQKYQLYPAGPAGLAEVLDDLVESANRIRESDASFRQALLHLFDLACSYASRAGLEICRPLGGEFVIGDAPALAIGEDGRLGPIEGVALNDATTAVLPVGPYRLISLGRDDACLDLSASQVEVLNHWQVEHAYRYVYYRPDSGMENLIRRAASAARLGRKGGEILPPRNRIRHPVTWTSRITQRTGRATSE